MVRVADEQKKLGEEKTDINKPIALELAKKQRDISVAEFFAKNRHLLGFDNKRKALLTTVKEAVDNGLDACEEAGILPEINVEIVDMGNDRFRVVIEDNGPGIVKKQIPNIFAKLLYGSKFHKLSQSRGQQGIGISASVMYAQLTTGKPAKITSKIDPKEPAHYYELQIDTQTNRPDIMKEEAVEWNKEHGTKIELLIEAAYQKGSQSVDEYLKETAIVNPHVTITYVNPKAEQILLVRATDKMPPKPMEIKPHPYGVELGILMSMLKNTEYRTLQSFLMNEFSRVGSNTAKQICENASLLTNTKPDDMTREMIEQLIKGIQNTKIISPPTDCISPLGEELLEKGLKKEINAEFYAVTTRPPAVYRGNPFVIEAGIAYGGEQSADEPVRLLRFANRVPLQYQDGACATTKAIISTVWRSYGLNQSKGSLPIGAASIAVHISSVWVPFTSESKEAIAHYPEIMKEIKLALQEVGRKLGGYLMKKRRVGDELKKRSYIEKYIPHVAEALRELTGYSKTEESRITSILKEILEKHRGKLEKVEIENKEYDEELAKIGKEEPEKEETLEDDSDMSKKRSKEEEDE
ncbi:DNA topoisomerase VI subunit B [Candidatus Woesearchaeota archaeon]|nr:DNA topoisomerase VI subunit B [Candidatus Woesearchaeota archaeon]